jgi:ATP-dependent RNA helicase RhlE
LKAGVDIVVATPGRMMDLYHSSDLILKQVKIFVMDEAERLLDMGFKKQIGRILSVMPTKRQNLLFSATWNDKVKSICEEFLVGPAEVRIEPEVMTVKTVSQVVYFVPNLKTKINLLEYLLDTAGFNKAMIFCKTKANATNIFKYIARKHGEEKVKLIHGNKDQNTRMNAIKQFSAEEVPYLITTDVASRGIDIRNVTHVINFDVPLIYEDYIHRIGRTGRALSLGDSVTFCSPNDEYRFRKIEKLIGQKIPVAQLPGSVEVSETPFEEQQLILREIDMQRRKEDPEFKGAFHEKKPYKK